MENKQINFFKSKDLNSVLKPYKKVSEVKIDSFDIRENQKDLNIHFLSNISVTHPIRG